ncbi:MAG: Gx transporter family protein, partial [Terriglobia bacterium]
MIGGKNYLRTRKMVVLSFFLGIGVVLYVAELFYFPPLPIPGAKLGLANAVTLILIGLYGWREPLSNSVGRTLVGALVTGTFLTPPFFFSLTG